MIAPMSTALVSSLAAKHAPNGVRGGMLHCYTPLALSLQLSRSFQWNQLVLCELLHATAF